MQRRMAEIGSINVSEAIANIDIDLEAVNEVGMEAVDQMEMVDEVMDDIEFSSVNDVL